MLDEEIWDGSARFAFPSSLMVLCRKDTSTAGRVVPGQAPVRWEGAAGIRVPGQLRGPRSSGGPVSTSHHPEMPCSSSASSVDLSLCRAVGITFR